VRVSETIVAKQSKHMDFFRLHSEEPTAERKISVSGNVLLEPLNNSCHNHSTRLSGRDERIVLSLKTFYSISASLLKCYDTTYGCLHVYDLVCLYHAVLYEIKHDSFYRPSASVAVLC